MSYPWEKTKAKFQRAISSWNNNHCVVFYTDPHTLVWDYETLPTEGFSVSDYHDQTKRNIFFVLWDEKDIKACQKACFSAEKKAKKMYNRRTYIPIIKRNSPKVLRIFGKNYGF